MTSNRSVPFTVRRQAYIIHPASQETTEHSSDELDADDCPQGESAPPRPIGLPVSRRRCSAAACHCSLRGGSIANRILQGCPATTGAPSGSPQSPTCVAADIRACSPNRSRGKGQGLSPSAHLRRRPKPAHFRTVSAQRYALGKPRPAVWATCPKGGSFCSSFLRRFRPPCVGCYVGLG